jgi:predicted N-acetyltransferase YhbS
MIALRRLRPEDLPAVVEVLAHWSMAPVAPSTACPVVERTALDPDTTFVALDGDCVVGVGSFWVRGDGWGETAVLAVHPDWLRRGIGGRLQAARLEELKRCGVARVRTEADRPEAIDWYVRRFGYRVAGTAPKKHPFSLVEVDRWTVLELEL